LKEAGIGQDKGEYDKDLDLNDINSLREKMKKE
jgi:hypothetical protein